MPPLALSASALATVVVLVVTVPAAARTANSTLLAATYNVSATINYGAGTISVQSTATVTNNTDQPIGELVFNLPPLRVGKAKLGATTAGAQTAAAAADDQSVVVTLPEALAPGRSTAVAITYSATLNTTTTDKNWLFAKLDGTLTAYRWIPWLSAAKPFDRPNYGSPFVTGVSSYVRVQLKSERPLTYGTSGGQISTSPDGLTRTFVARDVRDFNFAADPDYRKLTTWSGQTRIVVLYKDLPGTTVGDWARRSLEFYGTNIGPYVYPTLFVAETGGGTGMESPGMVWLPQGTNSSRIPYIVAHEVAHQWFYAMVGSDSASEPFADEALADFLARKVGASFRASKCSAQALDGTIWAYGSACYYEVIYIQGGNYLNAYRAHVGNTAFWSGLRAYYDAYKLKMGGTQQLWKSLDAASGYTAGHADRFPRYYPPGPPGPNPDSGAGL